jgi:hypothetical protein
VVGTRNLRDTAKTQAGLWSQTRPGAATPSWAWALSSNCWLAKDKSQELRPLGSLPQQSQSGQPCGDEGDGKGPQFQPSHKSDSLI